MYFEFDDARRLHSPYTDPFFKGNKHFSFYRTNLEARYQQLNVLQLETWNVCSNISRRNRILHYKL
jgi:hypothetical protein